MFYYKKGPFFENENELVRLDSSDAKFVDILHTNARPGSIPPGYKFKNIFNLIINLSIQNIFKSWICSTNRTC